MHKNRIQLILQWVLEVLILRWLVIGARKKTENFRKKENNIANYHVTFS